VPSQAESVPSRPVHWNLLLNPGKDAMCDGEFQWVNFSEGFDVDDSRLQFSFKYIFSQHFDLCHLARTYPVRAVGKTRMYLRRKMVAFFELCSIKDN
jgi:hypothetical protein